MTPRALLADAFAGLMLLTGELHAQAFNCIGGSSSFEFSIRADFNDLGPLKCPSDVANAQGATVSPSRNLSTDQNSLAVDGLVVADYRFYGIGNLQGISVGAFAQLNDTLQFEPSKTQAANADTITAGLVAETDFHALGGTHFLRIRGGEAFASSRSTSNSIVGEWIPVYATKEFLGQDIGFPTYEGNGIWVTFLPELMVQYDELAVGTSTNTLFASRAEALRVGPQLVVKLSLDQKDASAFLKPFVNFSATLTNHESWDVYTNRYFTWNSIAVTYTDPRFKNIGITASYGNGNSEATGNQTNQFKIGIAIKK
jgi:hypothetical protein